MLSATSFQDGVGGYSNTEDTVLYSISPDSNFGSETSISPDQQDANGVRQGLLRFNDIIGSLAGQVPLGSTINSATLQVSVVNSSTAQVQMSLYRMLEDWSEGLSTWNSFGEIGGVQSSEGEATGVPPDAILFDPNTGVMSFDVTRSLQNWAAGQENLGWLLESTATDGWDFETSEAAVADRPKLTVDYTAPSGAGNIEFIETKLVQAEGNSGPTTAQVTISRLGGVAGEVSATYTVAAGTAGGGDFVANTDTVTFADGETRKTIDVVINGDTALEGNETITVTLSNATGGATIGTKSVATLTIADDDALINEVLANVSASDPQNIITDETNHEYIELIGTPGASLNGYYFVVFEGQEEETAGTTDQTGSGVADLVVDLSGQTFGANGLLVLRPTDWVYTSHPDTNEMIVTALDAVAGGLEDDSQTYALVRSSVPIVQGTDYDTVGEYVNATRESVDSPLGSVGVLDVGPFADGTAQMVDSVSVFNGGSDRDRAAVTPEIGLPGVHIHQPTGASDSGNVASDALSRREGNFIPNTIGAWFNGDILDTRVDDPVIEYLNGTTRISVVAPGGSVLTPGTTNTLRNVTVSSAVSSVDEAGGPMVTFTVTRTGDVSQAIDVQYTTVNGTAQAGADYVAQSGTLSFAINEDTKEVMVQVIDDGIAEGFETFSLQLTAVDTPFLITENIATVTINDADVLVATFQDGVNGYFGTDDSYVDGENQFAQLGLDSKVIVDDAAGDPDFGGAEGADIRPQQGLLKFEDVFGAGLGQVPVGAQVFGGFLTLNVTNNSSSSAGIELYRMLQNWDELASWIDPQGTLGNSIVNGITPDGIEATSVADSIVTFPGQAGKVQVPLNQATLQAWSTGSLDNFGWSIVSDSDSSWEFSSSDVSVVNLRPELTILYTAPSGAGEFALVEAKQEVNEGGIATVKVQRVGGSTGAASIDYSITTGTAQAGDISGATSGTLNFANGELFKTFQVQTVGDNTLETNETVNITLNNGAVAAGLGAATLTIRDNDASLTSPPVLVSEIVYNQPGNDGGAELFELTGTPGAALGSFYAVVIAGDIGADQGATDLVVDLGQYEVGANGTVLIGSQNNFAWDVPAGTTFIGLPELDVEFLGGNDNGTSTYALVYSPFTPLHTGRFDYDWNNNGGLELPVGAEIVDSIAIRDNSSTDSTYGGGANTLQTNPTSSYDAVSRLPGTTARNNAASWYGADLFGSNDALIYDDNFSTGLPSVGAAVTPGELNTGTDLQNPIATIDSVDTSSGVVIHFNGTVSQVLVGDGTSYEGPGVGPGISVTKTDGTQIPGVNPLPVVSGFGTSSLSLSFLGTGTIGGQLPAGTYNLNFIGDSVVANGRALDAAGTGSPSNTSIQISVASTGSSADFDGDGDVDGRDFLAWQRGFGKPAAVKADGDADNDMDVDGEDLTVWQGQYDTTPPLVAFSTASDEAEPAPEVATASFAFTGNAWVALPTALATAGVTDAVFEAEFSAVPSRSIETETIDAAFTSNVVDPLDSLSSEVEEESAFDDAFADWDELTFVAV
ncbi:Calx-beta domain-containing protein [Bythopirellula goksoeyrii]|nr:Calx-beta domain-containing protein [Bythopirellula goksoeyrii]